MAEAGDNADRISVLCGAMGGARQLVSGDEAIAAARRLKEAEFLAEEQYEWAEIADAWLDYFGRDGLQNAIRCVQKSDTPASFCGGWTAGAESWIKIAKYDKQYEAQAELWLQRAEDEMEDDWDACFCAYTWISLNVGQSASRAFRLMKVAEESCDGTESNRDMVCSFWVRCFGESVGGEHVRRFLARTRGIRT